MKRRRFILLAGTSNFVLGGCVGISGRAQDGRISERSFKVYQPGSTGFQNAPEVNDKPTVEFQPDADTVIVRGKFFVGSSACNIARLTALRFDTESNTLHVKIGVGTKTHEGNSCGADESPDAYRLKVTFSAGLPERVDIEESGDPTAQSTTVNKP